MSHPDWRDLITNCFQSTEFMALSTYGDKGLWVNPVYFVWDDMFNLYFISQLDCTHMANIVSNAEVACAIFPTDKPAGDDVFGAYFKGHAKILVSEDEVKVADDLYYQRVHGDDQTKKDLDSYRSDPSWHFIKATLSELSYFDTRYFEENRVEVPKETWC